jgi:transcriptional regulator with XRE-family HTH domain
VPTLPAMYLRDLLRMKGIQTSAEFSRQLKISRQHAWLLWNGKTFPSLVTMQRLRDVLKLDPVDLTNLERETPPKQGRRPKRQTPPQGKRRRPRPKGEGGQS